MPSFCGFRVIFLLCDDVVGVVAAVDGKLKWVKSCIWMYWTVARLKEKFNEQCSFYGFLYTWTLLNVISWRVVFLFTPCPIGFHRNCLHTRNDIWKKKMFRTNIDTYTDKEELIDIQTCCRKYASMRTDNFKNGDRTIYGFLLQILFYLILNANSLSYRRASMYMQRVCVKCRTQWICVQHKT